MVFFAAVIVAIAVALLRGGQIRRLLDFSLRYESAILAALLLRVLLWLAGYRDLPLNPVLAWATQAVSHGLLLFVAGLNRSIPGAPMLGVGVLLNAVVILANGGAMPVSQPAAGVASGQGEAYASLLRDVSYLHQPLTSSTRFGFLGDVLAFPGWFPVNTAFSIGDLFVVAGIFTLVQYAMLVPRPQGPLSGRIA